MAPINYLNPQVPVVDKNGIISQAFWRFLQGLLPAGGGGSPIGGTIGANQVAFGTATNTLGGSPNFLWNGSELGVSDGADGAAAMLTSGELYSQIADEASGPNLELVNVAAAATTAVTVQDDGTTTVAPAGDVNIDSNQTFVVVKVRNRNTSGGNAVFGIESTDDTGGFATFNVLVHRDGANEASFSFFLPGNQGATPTSIFETPGAVSWELFGDFPYAVSSEDDGLPFPHIVQNTSDTAGSGAESITRTTGDTADGNASNILTVHRGGSNEASFRIDVDGASGNATPDTTVSSPSTLRFTKQIQPPTVAFAGLPAVPAAGMLINISDSNTVVWGATIAGGGANHVLARYNGANWTVVGK